MPNTQVPNSGLLCLRNYSIKKLLENSNNFLEIILGKKLYGYQVPLVTANSLDMR